MRLYIATKSPLRCRGYDGAHHPIFTKFQYAKLRRGKFLCKECRDKIKESKMKVSPKKITFTITKTETIQIVVSEENGFDMPKTVKDIIAQDSDINCNPLGYVDNNNNWESESVEVSDIEYE